MWKCPVCDHSNDTPFCPICGFDRSLDPLVHPTFGPVPGDRKAPSRLRSERQDLLICPGCGGTAFSLDQSQGLLRCLVCGCTHQSAAKPARKTITAIAAGDAHTVVLYDDGTVRAVGKNNACQCNTGSWRDIVAIAAGFENTLGLRRDGTVVAVGNNYAGKSMVHTLRNVKAIATSTGSHTLALHQDGTVTSLGRNEYGECNGVDAWRGICGISIGAVHSIGWNANGKILAAGNDPFLGQLAKWRSLRTITSGTWHALGLKTDGTALAAGRNTEKQCEISHWHSLVQLVGGKYYTAGLHADGTVSIATTIDRYPPAESWTDITILTSGETHLVGLRRDGSLVAIGVNDDGQCNVDPLWDL